MGFYSSMQKELNTQKSFTTNGAVAYETSGKKLLDFNFGVSAMRGLSPVAIADKFMKVFFEDKKTAMEYLFYLGDIREGLGERKAFRSGLMYLTDKQPKLAKAIMPLIPHYNRWDSILYMVDNQRTRAEAIKLIKKQLKEDRANMKLGKPVSLCAKWMPSINASSKKTKALAKTICQEFGWTERKYRKRLVKLRKYLDVVEVKMSKKEWGNINYEAVPSKANLIYNNAFLRNDEERRRKFLESLSRGEAKINASTLNPHEICYKYRRSYSYRADETLEALWKALPDLSVENTLVVRDGSGSMAWGSTCGSNATPLDVATALAIYMSEHNTGEWKDKFVTFSSSPKIVDLSNCDTLCDKVSLAMNEADCSNTDIYKTMMLVLRTAVKNKMTQDDMPSMIVICSDMQFDGTRFNLDKSLFDDIADEFARAGYKLPKICFWNLDGRLSNTVPMQQNDMGLILCSGFSVQILRMFMSNQIDPYKVLLETLHSKRYDKVREAIEGLI
jgi:hypothetical protein